MFRQLLTALATVFRTSPKKQGVELLNWARFITHVFEQGVTPQLSHGGYGGHSKNHTSSRWWLRRKARLRMQRESRRINRRAA